MNHRKCPTCSEVDKFNLIGTMLNCAKCGCEIALEDYEISTKWVPTLEELESLGFETSSPYKMCYVLNLERTSIGYQFVWDYFFLYEGEKELNVYPKSLEELRSIISMMKP